MKVFLLVAIVAFLFTGSLYSQGITYGNFLNPYIPPRPILFSGMKSTDEMLNLFLHYTDYKEGDEVAENW